MAEPWKARDLQGPNAVSVARVLVGATDPASAAPGTIRGDFGLIKALWSTFEPYMSGQA